MEQDNIFENRIDLRSLSQTVANIRQEVAKLIIGQHKMVDLLITAILADGHVLIEGVPGVAKTLTAKILSRILSVDFSRIQFTPDLMPSDVLGTSIFNLKTSEFNFKKGPIFANLVLIDEINRSPAKTQAALFEVMEERQITIDGICYPMRPPFLVLATQNGRFTYYCHSCRWACIDRRSTRGCQNIDCQNSISYFIRRFFAYSIYTRFDAFRCFRNFDFQSQNFRI